MAIAQRPHGITVTAEARRALARWRRHSGPQALFLSWPSGVVCLPYAAFDPGPYDVIVGHVSGCPVHADVRQLATYRDRSAVLDVRPNPRSVRPAVRLRPTT